MTMMNAAPMLWAQLPAGGWQIGFLVCPAGYAMIDVVDSCGSLVHRATGGQRPALSIDAGWAGGTFGPDGQRQGWALAIGHVPAGLGHLVSFSRGTNRTRRDRMTLPSEAPSGLSVVHDGLWAAAAAGDYAYVRLTARSTTCLQPLRMVTLPALGSISYPGGKSRPPDRVRRGTALPGHRPADVIVIFRDDGR